MLTTAMVPCSPAGSGSLWSRITLSDSLQLTMQLYTFLWMLCAFIKDAKLEVVHSAAGSGPLLLQCVSLSNSVTFMNEGHHDGAP